MITAALILAALCCCGGAALLALLLPASWATLRRLLYLVLAVATVLLAVAGFRADLGQGGFLDLGTALGFGSSSLRADPLSGLFLAITGVVATPIMLGFFSWSAYSADVPFRKLPAVAGLTVAGIAVVLTADNAFVFLFGWESISVAFYLLSGYRRDLPGRSRASMITYAFSKTSGSFLLVAFLMLAGTTGSFGLASWSGAHGAARQAGYALALIGFTAKVGVVPLQVWLPGGYAAAPGPARALMSAVAANIGFYGMWRLLSILGKPPVWIAAILLLSAAFTAVLGIAHAAVQRDLQRVIAYSSVENGGLITAGYAIALAGAAVGLPKLVALGLLTSALQMITQALAKSSLFLATARIEQVTGESDLDQLLGAGRADRVTATAFTLGAYTLAGLPLTVGFVSEWFLLEAVMQLFRLHELVLQLAIALTGAGLALTAGYAGFTFVRLVGMMVLGPATARPVTRVAPALGSIGKLALLIPSLGCVGVAALTPWEIRFVAHGLAPLVAARTTASALAQPWVLQPIYGKFSALSPSWLAIELPLLAILVLLLAAVVTRGAMFRVRRVPAWRSATGGVSGDARYTSFAFANPTRHVLGNLLLTKAVHVPDVAGAALGGGGPSVFTGPDMPGGPALPGASPVHGAYRTDVVELVELFAYRPALRPLRRLVAIAKGVQSGRLDAYVAYMLLALLALLAVVVAMS